MKYRLTTCYNSPQRIVAIQFAKIAMRNFDWMEAADALLEVMKSYYRNDKINNSLNPFKDL